MNPKYREEAPQIPKEEKRSAGEKPNSQKVHSNMLVRWVNTLLSIGLGESMLRVGTAILSLILIATVIGLLNIFNDQVPLAMRVRPALAAGPTATPSVDPSLLPPPMDTTISGILRLALPRTNIPTRPRQDITKYTVQTGDTVFGIAEKFGLEPQTILWGNQTVLEDDPHSLYPGQELNILPVNGIYYEWLGGISFEDWAKYFGVTAQDIIEYPGNHLDPDTIGNYANPNIKSGTWLIIPGGRREYSSPWYLPVGSSREEPATARQWGEGACGPVTGGAVGYGTYVWPTPKHIVNGYNFSPETNHWGIDIDGEEGDPIYATDAGVIVYAGWNNYGYGNMIMIDHGGGWQSLYAHIMLNGIWVVCGQSVDQGQTIAGMGTTGKSSGPHLHFEILHGATHVNPWNLLPPP